MVTKRRFVSGRSRFTGALDFCVLCEEKKKEKQTKEKKDILFHPRNPLIQGAPADTSGVQAYEKRGKMQDQRSPSASQQT